MKLVTVSGPPSCGKTSVILRLAESLTEERLGAVKFDCLTSFDEQQYSAAGIPVRVGFSGKLCPDHYFISNIDTVFNWGKEEGFDILFTESAGLCNRCSPHIRSVLSICVIDNLSGINTPRKIGPMLRFADVIVVTKGDIVSQAEREVFDHNIRQVNAKAVIIHINGITGQGVYLLRRIVEKAPDMETLAGMSLRFTTPSSICSYCTGETMIGEQYRLGMLKKMELKK